MSHAIANGRSVVLTRLQLNDINEFLTSVARSQQLHGEWVSAPSTEQQFNDYFTKCRLEHNKGFLIKDRETNDLIGVINLSEIVRGCFHSAYLGYYLFDGHQQKGLMAEAMSLLIDHAFYCLGLHRLEANIQPDNSRSIALIKKLGFEQEGYSKHYLKINGQWQDHLRFALTIEEAQRQALVKANASDTPWAADFDLDKVSVNEILVASFPKLDIQSTKKIAEGWDNAVFEVNGTLLFRFPRRKIAISLIERENTALSLVRETIQSSIEIPNPAFQSIGPADYPYPFHGYEKIAGNTVYECDLSLKNRLESIDMVADFLKQLHQVPLSEVYAAGIERQVFDRTNANRIAQQLMAKVEKLSKCSLIKINQSVISKICEQAKTVRLDRNQHCLVHGDLYCRHLLFADNRLAGIIDWGDVGVSHPVVDLALLYHFYPIEARERFYHVYGQVEQPVRTYAEFLGVYGAISYLDYALDVNDKALEKEALWALSNLLP